MLALLTGSMKVTAILRDFSPAFYEGFPPSIPSFLAMSPREQYETLVRLGNERVPLQIGNGSFRDRVDHNQIHRDTRCHIAFKLEPRKGYKLGTFEFTLA